MKWLGLLLLAGCTHTESAVADPSAAPPAPPTAAQLQHVSDALALLHRQQDPTSNPVLGASCSGTPLCGTRGRVALQLHPWGARPSPEPCTRVSLPGGPSEQPGPRMNRIEACVAGDRLHLRELCVICRAMSTDDYEAILTELTPAQREHLRGRLGLAAKADLDDASDWKDAIRATAP